MPGKCCFNNIWLHKDIYKSWLEKTEDRGKAKCVVCRKTFDISNMGEATLSSHAKGAKHHAAVAACEASAITSFFRTTPPPQPATVTPPAVCSSSTATSSLKQGTLNSVITRNEVLTSEVLWALKVANAHFSYKSCEDLSQLFQAIFPDSQIAKKFACGERKCAYLCTFGLAPYFKGLTLRRVSAQRYVMLFDESLNHYLQSKQVDMHVRAWDGPEVKTTYISSGFLGHATDRKSVV